MKLKIKPLYFPDDLARPFKRRTEEYGVDRLLRPFTSVVVASVTKFGALTALITFTTSEPLSEEEENLFPDLIYIARNDPGQLKAQTPLQEFDTRLKPVQAGLIVREDNRKQLISCKSGSLRLINRRSGYLCTGNEATLTTKNSRR